MLQEDGEKGSNQIGYTPSNVTLVTWHTGQQGPILWRVGL